MIEGHDKLCPYEIGGDECHCYSIQNAREDEQERIYNYMVGLQQWGCASLVSVYVSQVGSND